MKILLGSIGAAAVIVAAVAAAMAFGVVPIPGVVMNLLSGANPPEHSAKYYPEDTLAYAWLTLAPGQGQFEESLEIWDRFMEIREFSDLYDEFTEEMEDETGIEFEEDLKPWVGPDFSFGLTWEGTDGDDPLVAATLGVRDGGAAEDFLDQWLEYLEDEEGADFDRDSYGGFDIWVDEYEEQVYGLSGDLLVFATTEDFLEEVIDGVNGDARRTLADSQRFQDARAALPDRRFFSLYIDVEATAQAAEDVVGPEFGLEFGNAADSAPEWIMTSAAWGDRTVSVETMMPAILDDSLEFPDLDAPVSILPHDTLALASVSFDPNLDNWRDYLAQYQVSEVLGEEAVYELNDGIGSLELFLDGSDLPTLDERSGFDFFLDLAIEMVDQATGIDLEKDFFDYLGGQVSVAAWDLTLSDDQGGLEENPVSVVALLSYLEQHEDDLVDTVEEAEELLEDDAGILLESVAVGAGSDARIYYSQPPYSPGYVLNDGYLIFGSTEDALADIVELQEDGGDSLDSNPEYRRAVENLPDRKHLLVYVDLNGVARQIDPDSGDVPPEVLEIWEETLSGAAVSAYTPGTQDADSVDRYAVVLTLFPE